MKFSIYLLCFIFSVGALACPHLEGTYLANGQTFEVKRYFNEKGQVFFEMFGNIHTPGTTHDISYSATGMPIHYSYSSISCEEKSVNSETIDTLRGEVIWGDIINGKETYRNSFVEYFYLREDGAFVVEHVANDGESSFRIYPKAP